MHIEIFDNTDTPELRVYEIDDKCSRVLIDKTRRNEVWGFIEDKNNLRQVEGKLLEVISPVVLMG